MKRIFLLIAMMGILDSVGAQSSLRIEKLFDSFRKHPNATEVVVKGKELKPYNLFLFRSLTVTRYQTAMDRIEQFVQEESKKAIDKEEGLLGGRLYYGFYCLPSTTYNRYFFYRNTGLKKGAPNEVTLVYMEGYATLEQLKQMFK